MDRDSLPSLESDTVRNRSLELFRSIKLICVELLQSSNDPSVSEATLEHLLRTLSLDLHNASKDTDLSEYIISTKLADYIFVPLSNILNRPSLLNNDITRHILDVLTFLINQSWAHNLDVDLLDQLGPLVVYLSGGISVRSAEKSDQETLLKFVLSAALAIEAILNCVPRDYFSGPDNAKRLSILGDSTTILLAFLQTIDARSEQNARSILSTLSLIYSTRVSAEQASHVFPGMVSKVINFYLTTKNLHSATIISIIEFLRKLVVRVFADDTLDLFKSDDWVLPDSTEAIQHLLESSPQPTDLPVSFHIQSSTGKHRTESWLRATSKQFKLSLLAFFKALLLESGPNAKARIASNQKLAISVLELISDILRKCFKSLFEEMVLVTVDIVSVLYHALTDCGADDDPDLLSKITTTFLYLNRSSLELVLTPLINKTENFISSQLESALAFASEERLALCLSALLVHFHICQEILSALMKSCESVVSLKKSALSTVARSLHQNIASTMTKRPSQTSKANFLAKLSETGEPDESNALDDIRLPPEIDARKVVTLTPKNQQPTSSRYVSALQRINLDLDLMDREVNSLYRLEQVYGSSTEKQLRKTLSFFGKDSTKNLEIFVSDLRNSRSFSDDSELENLLALSVSLWISNILYKSEGVSNNFDISEFLNFGDDQETASDIQEADYMLLETAKQAIYHSQNVIENGLTEKAALLQAYEMLQAVALETIGILATRFEKEEFQTEVLMDYLYPLLESFANAPESVTHALAKLALKRISDAHYNGSLQLLITENADYLIDSLSIKFSISSGLTPALSGILLVVLKISGVELLQTNQLQDIIAEMFIAIDSYHGYSVLVENFFVVFHEIILKVKELYKNELSDSKTIAHTESAFKPWGMTSINQMLSLIKENENRVELPTIDQNKEYFRKPGVPFSEQLEDSDDEDDEKAAQEQEPREENKWDSFVAINIYRLIEQIFKYGCQMLTHSSIKLRIQILHTLRAAYPLLSTNYRILMPLLADYFPLLLVLCTGSSSLSVHTRELEESLNQVSLIIPALELLQDIIIEDGKHEKFMSSRFVEIWNFFKERSSIIVGIVGQDRSFKTKSSIQLITSAKVNARIRELYSQVLLTGLNTYERTVPDLLAHEMVRVCTILGIQDSFDLGREVRNHLWVLQNC